MVTLTLTVVTVTLETSYLLLGLLFTISIASGVTSWNWNIGSHGASSPPVDKFPFRWSFDCYYKGKGYNEGEEFHLDDSGCLKCVCKQGWEVTEEYCHTADCGLKTYYPDKLTRGCHPIYFQDAAAGLDYCCPVAWQCPDEKNSTEADTQVGIPQQPSSSSIVFGLVTITTSRFSSATPTLGNLSTTYTSQSQSQCVPVQTEADGRFSYCVTTLFNDTCGPVYICKGFWWSYSTPEDCELNCINFRKNLVEQEGKTQTIGYIQIQDSNSKATTPKQFPKQAPALLINPCNQRLKPGLCKVHSGRYYFSPEENKCEFFVFGGCGGNGNNFLSRESCEATCLLEGSTRRTRLATWIDERNKATIESSPPAPPFPHPVTIDLRPVRTTPPEKRICSLAAESGPCEEVITRYYYDYTLQQCKQFKYGGCGGNSNNFHAFDKCQLKCGGHAINET